MTVALAAAACTEAPHHPPADALAVLDAPTTPRSGLGWHCARNLAFKGGWDSVCGRSLAECDALVAIRRESHSAEGVPFEPSSCAPAAVVHGFTFRDSDAKWWHFRAFTVPSRCAAALANPPQDNVPLTACHPMTDPSLWPERVSAR
jgi:hypothetical protein